MIKKIKKAFSQKPNLIPVMLSLHFKIRALSFGSKESHKKNNLAGSMTVEAALVMPIFLFFMMSILAIFHIISMQAETYQDLHQRGNRIAFEGYQNRSQQDDGIISLTETYRIKPYLLWQDFGQLVVVQNYYGYAWIGYDIDRDENSEEDLEDHVYIAETGTVYHLTMECSHLKLSVTSVDGSTVASLRNDSGGKYYPCERCPDEDNGTLFITSFGTRYHADVNCSGLKRTVSILALKEAVQQGYRGCSRCS